MKTINIAGLDKPKLLAALFSASCERAMGIFSITAKQRMSAADAAAHLAKGDTFKKLNGRVLNVSLAHDELDPTGYNAENGELAAELVVQGLRQCADLSCTA